MAETVRQRHGHVRDVKYQLRGNERHATVGKRSRVRTGIPWRDLPRRYGPWQTVYKRFARWQTDGTWTRIEAALVAEVAPILDRYGGTAGLLRDDAGPLACWPGVDALILSTDNAMA
jgi:transposase